MDGDASLQQRVQGDGGEYSHTTDATRPQLSGIPLGVPLKVDCSQGGKGLPSHLADWRWLACDALVGGRGGALRHVWW